MTNRQIEVLRIMLRDKKTTIAKLAKELEVHIRTIDRNIDKLIDMDVPISKRQGRGGGVSIDEKYNIDTALLKDKDIHELLSAINIYKNLFKTQFLERMNQKITLLNLGSIETIINITESHFIVDLFEEQISIQEKIEEPINKALASGWMVKAKFKEGKHIKMIEFFPIAYVLNKEGLSVYAFDGEYKLIPITKIIEVNTCKENKGIQRNNLIAYRDNTNIKRI